MKPTNLTNPETTNTPLLELINQFSDNHELEQKLFSTSATEQEIANFKTKIGLELPGSFYDLYRWHNGSKADKGVRTPLHNEEYLLPLSEILVIKENLDNNLNEGKYDDYKTGSWWDKAWVPFTAIGSWFVRVIDTKGSYNTGLAGQIIAVDYKSEADRFISHDSFDNWLKNIAELMKAGILVYGDYNENRPSFEQIAAIEDIDRSISPGFPTRIPIKDYKKISI